MTDQNNNHPPPELKSDDRPWPTLTIDYELYEKMLEESDASNEEKRNFIDAIWAVTVAFASLRFGVHPVQQICEGGDLELSRKISTHLLDSMDTSPAKQFLQAAESTKPIVNKRDEQ
ncbi:MAG: hypothetical protein ACI9SP_000725 [Arenicella sp.]|jgi:hypothetical protein